MLYHLFQFIIAITIFYTQLSLLMGVGCSCSALSITSPSKSGKVINHLLQRTSLTHSYYALRHGQSLANVAKIISSDPAISTVDHGLSHIGKEQAKFAGEAFASEYIRMMQQQSNNKKKKKKYKGVAIFSSDFTRARETASIFANELHKTKQIPMHTGDVVLEKRLRERYFGVLNGGPDTRYQEVWDIDCIDPDHTEFDVESANSVLERTTKLITELDEQLAIDDDDDDDDDNGSTWKCILVAHGDVLQIMQTGFLKHSNASKHRSLEHLETATIRELLLE